MLTNSSVRDRYRTETRDTELGSVSVPGPGIGLARKVLVLTTQDSLNMLAMCTAASAADWIAEKDIVAF